MFDAIMRKVDQDGKEDHKPDIFSVDFEASVTKCSSKGLRAPRSLAAPSIWGKPSGGRCTIYSSPALHKDTDFHELVYMVYALMFVPADKTVDY